MDEEKILICEDGDVVNVGEKLEVDRKSVPAGYVYVDGTVGDIGAGVLRDHAWPITCVFRASCRDS